MVKALVGVEKIDHRQRGHRHCGTLDVAHHLQVEIEGRYENWNLPLHERSLPS